MADKDLYRILGVERSADAQHIKKRYRELAREFHPDRNPEPSAEARFKEISAAFAVLGDEAKRKVYDEFGVDGLREGFDADSARNYQRWAGQFGGVGPGTGGMGGGFGGFGDLDDLLGSLFGGGGFGPRGPQRQPQRESRSIERSVTISLRQALDGAELQLSELGGKVRVPPGVSDGQKMRLTGKGPMGPRGRGDVILKLAVAQPPGYERHGDNLQVDLPLTLSQAYFGGQLDVPTPEGALVKLNVPRQSQSGQRLRLRHKGMPMKGGGRGHLHVRLLVRVPGEGGEDLEALLRELDDFY